MKKIFLKGSIEMLKKFSLALAVIIFIFSVAPTKTFAGEVVKVVGVASGPKNAVVGSNFYKSFARQAAKLDGLCQLVETIQGINVDGETTVEGGEITSDKMIAHSTIDEKFWRKHFSKIEIVDVKFNSDGGCEVTINATKK